MTRRSKQVIAAWFILQIVLPLTAPQTLEGLRYLFGVQVHRSVTTSPESTTTPTMNETTSENAGVSLISPAGTAGTSVALPRALQSSRVLIASSHPLFSAPQVQRSVLRV
jgi:hypothetical protein